MKYTISQDRSRLTLTVDKEERAELRELGETIHQDSTLAGFAERTIANSELDWVDPFETGDLTDAPMLGIRAGELAEDHDRQDAPRIVERWAWMDYQVRSLLEELRDNGEAVLIGGN